MLFFTAHSNVMKENIEWISALCDEFQLKRLSQRTGTFNKQIRRPERMKIVGNV
jgi:hypothetical protein